MITNPSGTSRPTTFATSPRFAIFAPTRPASAPLISANRHHERPIRRAGMSDQPIVETSLDLLYPVEELPVLAGCESVEVAHHLIDVDPHRRASGANERQADHLPLMQRLFHLRHPLERSPVGGQQELERMVTGAEDGPQLGRLFLGQRRGAARSEPRGPPPQRRYRATQGAVARRFRPGAHPSSSRRASAVARRRWIFSSWSDFLRYASSILYTSSSMPTGLRR